MYLYVFLVLLKRESMYEEERGMLGGTNIRTFHFCFMFDAFFPSFSFVLSLVCRFDDSFSIHND